MSYLKPLSQATFPWFLTSFLLTLIIGALFGCSLPDRKPESYERRATAPADSESTTDEWAAAKHREYAQWWNCSRDKREGC
jgi:hypothetical protein